MSKLIKAISTEILYGDHLVASGAFGIVLSVILIFELDISLSLLGIAYIAFLIIYSYNHSREISFDVISNPERVQHVSGRIKWVKFSPYVYSLILSVLLIGTNVETISLTIFILTGGILYTIRLKKVPILGWKNFYTSFFWGVSVLLIPFFYEIKELEPYLLLAFFIFLRGLVNTIFFDIKDIESDSKRNLKTFPVVFGKKNVIIMLQILNIITLLPLFLGIAQETLPSLAIVFVLTAVNSVFYLTKAIFMSGDSLRILSYILVDGEYILWPLVIFIISKVI